MNEYHISKEQWEEAKRQVREIQSQIQKSSEKEKGSCFFVYTCKESMDRIKRELSMIQGDEKENYKRIIECHNELLNLYENYLVQVEEVMQVMITLVKQMQNMYEKFCEHRRFK